MLIFIITDVLMGNFLGGFGVSFCFTWLKLFDAKKYYIIILYLYYSIFNDGFVFKNLGVTFEVEDLLLGWIKGGNLENKLEASTYRKKSLAVNWFSQIYWKELLWEETYVCVFKMCFILLKNDNIIFMWKFYFKF